MILQVRNLGFEYIPGHKVFHDVSFTLERGEVLSILGTNGAGKSTMLNCIANLFKPTEGEILLDGVPMSSMRMNDVAKVIGYVPQVHRPSFAFSVREFVVMGRTPYIGAFTKPKARDYEIAERAMDRMGIRYLENKVFTELSGGEQQLVMLSRVLTQEPEIILLDEPTNHLDYGNQYRTMNMIRTLSSEGYTVLMTTHNPDHAIMLDGKVAILNSEGVLGVGQAADAITSETLTNLYGLNVDMIYSDKAERNICFVCGD